MNLILENGQSHAKLGIKIQSSVFLKHFKCDYIWICNENDAHASHCSTHWD